MSEEVAALEKALGERSFPDFEQAPKGQIDIHAGSFKRTKFKMRIGLHLQRPTQAIIADGHFVRMRAAPEYVDYELKVLDANNPDNCPYEQLVAEVGSFTGKRWRPVLALKAFSSAFAENIRAHYARIRGIKT